MIVIFDTLSNSVGSFIIFSENEILNPYRMDKYQHIPSYMCMINQKVWIHLIISFFFNYYKSI